MDSTLTHRPRGRQGGYVLVAVAALTTVLLATGIAFMRWSTDEATQSREAVAGMQAYYLAQMGVVEQGLCWLRSQQEISLPTGDIPLPGRHVSNDPDAAYENVIVSGLNVDEGSFYIENRRFKISAVGRVRIPFYQNHTSTYRDIRRQAVLFVQVRSFADYMYLSQCELTRWGERIRFWGGDTLEGRVHSNSQIAIMNNPQFYDQVSTTEDDFEHGPGYNPGFHGPLPQFRAPAVLVPHEALNLRIGASTEGNYYAQAGKSYRVRLEGAMARIFVWDTGTPFDSTVSQPVPIVGRTCMFFERPLELYGVLNGQLSIGSSETIRLIDNVWYDCTTLRQAGGYNPVPDQCDDILGIISEAEVKVANTWANGREDSHGRGNSQANRDSTDIVIMGAVVALGESFTFEQQNDPDSGYQYTQGNPPVPHTDDRGQIYLHGSVTQWRRGYVHRSNNGSTGYLKKYKYDRRFRWMKPPCFFHVQDEQGRALFNIVQWGGQQFGDEVHPRETTILPRFN